MRRIHSYFACAAISLIFSFQEVAAQRSEYWHQRASLFEMLPIHSSDIVFLGNSITDGGEFAELFNNPSIKNRGISGDVTDGVLERLKPITVGKPAKVFLLIGINDISHNTSVDAISSNYRKIVKQIKKDSPSTRLYLQSVFPINNDFNRYRLLAGKSKTVHNLNLEIRRIANEEGATFIDLTDILADDDGKLNPQFTNDGLHLTGKGYLEWAKAVRSFVEE